jgi:hypothetical protein
MRRFVLTLALMLPTSTALAGNPWEELMGKDQGKTWTDPGGRFSLKKPVNWTARPRKGAPQFVDFEKTHPDYGHSARLTVEMRYIPPKVRLSHFALRVEKEIRKQARNYRPLAREKTKLDNKSGIRTHFTYQVRGNAQLTNEVQQIIAISGERAWIITFETAAGVQRIFQEDYRRMIRTFSAMAAGEITTQRGKKRRRIRAGEMVNPDMIKY